ncbi:hypothetical protein CANARDRAFT_28458 [[Candida] arabinofermentans NRRL YB-2248]|uniref:AAA+ ATPase domain-containing protein n=1 Tax=[Candida] arabinofermentans NRRL YB-2248 TaxID=983967 RepID=A0A1E4T0C8_9ASCO|nr:hypothetical protein CANARDRAFT_28458 [[Candida] arabinofermentans NRRL YB-2248]
MFYIRRTVTTSLIAGRFVSSGPRGYDNRTPTLEGFSEGDSNLIVTDPLIIYRSYVARGILKEDLSQLRAAVEFQKLYFRLKDYKPDDKSIRVNQLIRELEIKFNPNRNDGLIFSTIGYKPKWYVNQNQKKRTALINVITDEDELENFPSPQGLLVNGEVGCGKSMLLDIFANSLPIDRKLRIHYNNFILWVYTEIHNIYERRKRSNQDNHTILSLENEFILFEVASRMISKHYVLMLDEFMLPDLASAKIIKILFTYFFKLGGVIVATSNRLPEELYSTDFNKTQFQTFERILKLRCQVFDMSSESDYRVILKDEKLIPYLVVRKHNNDHDQEWTNLINQHIDVSNTTPTSFTSYGRTINIPLHHEGAIMIDFDDLCKDSTYGPSDYISLASRYHTVIIDNIPVMTLKLKNEARRFITLLDSLYESRCRTLFRMDADPSELFFPYQDPSGTDFEEVKSNNLEIQEEEMFARTQLYLANPYRPNIQSYEEGENIFKQGSELGDSIEPGKLGPVASFKDSSKFTGEDEMFAYKRAVSRINEMAYSANWRLDGRWIPNDTSLRPWESSSEGKFEMADAVPHDPARIPGSGYEPGIGYTAEKALNEAREIKSYNFWGLGNWKNKANLTKDDIAKRWLKGATN